MFVNDKGHANVKTNDIPKLKSDSVCRCTSVCLPALSSLLFGFIFCLPFTESAYAGYPVCVILVGPSCFKPLPSVCTHPHAQAGPREMWTLVQLEYSHFRIHLNI